jgi:hypothetical protein
MSLISYSLGYNPISKSLSLKSQKDIFSILMEMNELEYFSDFEKIETIDTITMKDCKITKRKMMYKNVLPKYLFYILPKSIFYEINTYYDDTTWHFNDKKYTFDISCPKWYRINGNAQFNDQEVRVEMDFEIIRNFPSKQMLQKKMLPFILDRYLMTIKKIDESS